MVQPKNDLDDIIEAEQQAKAKAAQKEREKKATK